MLRRLWHAIRFFAAAHVRSRDELDTALRRKPRFIVIEGNEALRAYAASLAYRGGQEAAEMEQAAADQPQPVFIVVPTVGRIRDGFRQRPQQDRRAKGPRSESGRRKGEPHKTRLVGGRRNDRFSIQAGVGTVLAAASALIALLGAEWLLWPSGTPELVRGPHHVAVPPHRGAEVPLPTHAPPPPPLTTHQNFIHVLVPVLVVAAIAAMLFLVWQAIGPGRPVRISWRVAHRIPGQLVIARVRTKTA